MSGLLLYAFITKAETSSYVKKENDQVKTHQVFQGIGLIREEEPKAVQCTVSLKGSVYLGLFSIEITCSGTGTTCQQATEKAATCLQEAIKAVKQVLD